MSSIEPPTTAVDMLSIVQLLPSVGLGGDPDAVMPGSGDAVARVDHMVATGTLALLQAGVVPLPLDLRCRLELLSDLRLRALIEQLSRHPSVASRTLFGPRNVADRGRGLGTVLADLLRGTDVQSWWPHAWSPLTGTSLAIDGGSPDRCEGISPVQDQARDLSPVAPEIYAFAHGEVQAAMNRLRASSPGLGLFVEQQVRVVSLSTTSTSAWRASTVLTHPGRIAVEVPDSSDSGRTPALIELLLHETMHNFMCRLEIAGAARVHVRELTEISVVSPWSRRLLTGAMLAHAIVIWLLLLHYWRGPGAAVDAGYADDRAEYISAGFSVLKADELPEGLRDLASIALAEAGCDVHRSNPTGLLNLPASNVTRPPTPPRNHGSGCAP